MQISKESLCVSYPIKRHLISQIGTLKTIIDKANKCIRIRFYDATPRISLYNWDDNGYVGIFWRDGRHVIDSIQFRIKGKDTGLAMLVDHEFNYLWERSSDFEDVCEQLNRC